MAHNEQHTELLEEVIDVRVHTKVTKGGRNLSFAALVAVGDGHGKVGIGYGKARGVPVAIEKANKRARRDMAQINLISDTIVHETTGTYGSTKVLLRPASAGTGIKAGATVRLILKVLGVHSVLSKCFGSNNALNVAKATMKALREQRSVEQVERLRGRKIAIRHPQQRRPGAAQEQAQDQKAVQTRTTQ